jgi:hypothetical protein
VINVLLQCAPGNSFLKAVYDAGETSVAVGGDPRRGFIYPSYVEDVMGPVCFDYGYGPFRYVALSGSAADLRACDAAAMSQIERKRAQDSDNYVWIRDAERNKLVVGTQVSGCCVLMHLKIDTCMRHAGAHIVRRRADTRSHWSQVQRAGARRRDRTDHARPRSPRHGRHRLAVPRDGQHQGRLQRHG